MKTAISTSTRGGFTLVELLVCIAIIGMLVMLLLPAIQATREASRRSACVNNLKQISTALQNYESAYKHFPPGRGDPLPRVFSTFAYLLPYLEEAALRDQIIFNQPPTTFTVGSTAYDGAANESAARTKLQVLICPSDPAAGIVSASEFGTANYAATGGSGMIDLGNLKIADGVFFTGSTVRFKDIIDGASHTAAFSERLLGVGGPAALAVTTDPTHHMLQLAAGSDPTTANCASAAGDTFTERGGKWILGNYGNTIYDHYYTPNASVWDCMNIQQQKGLLASRSAHPGGVEVQKCDASVEFVADDIAANVWHAMATRSGHD
jgi:prepilin-type N-terminal cleavage/methylation domain-containing protein